MSKISKCLPDFVCFVKNLKMFLLKNVKNLKMFADFGFFNKYVA